MTSHAQTPSDIASTSATATPRTDGARFFMLDDDDEVTYWVVAIDLDHAKNIIRKLGLEFGCPSQPLDRATGLTWSEVTTERAARLRCHIDDEPSIIPLSEAPIGELFSTEW